MAGSRHYFSHGEIPISLRSHDELGAALCISRKGKFLSSLI